MGLLIKFNPKKSCIQIGNDIFIQLRKCKDGSWLQILIDAPKELPIRNVSITEIEERGLISSPENTG